MRKSAVDDVIAEASLLRSSGDFLAVVAQYESAVVEYDEDARVWYNLAVAYAEAGKLEASLKAFENLNGFTGRSNTKYLKAESTLALELGLVDKAIDLWTEVVSLDPMEFEVRLKLIDALSEKGRYEQAYTHAMELYEAGFFEKVLFTDLATLERKTGRGDGIPWSVIASTYR